MEETPLRKPLRLPRDFSNEPSHLAVCVRGIKLHLRFS